MIVERAQNNTYGEIGGSIPGRGVCLSIFDQKFDKVVVHLLCSKKEKETQVISFSVKYEQGRM